MFLFISACSTVTATVTISPEHEVTVVYLFKPQALTCLLLLLIHWERHSGFDCCFLSIGGIHRCRLTHLCFSAKGLSMDRSPLLRHQADGLAAGRWTLLLRDCLPTGKGDTWPSLSPAHPSPPPPAAGATRNPTCRQNRAQRRNELKHQISFVH